MQCLYFVNGKVKIRCPGEIDDRGDLNLNSVAYEIADAVLYSNYFILGPSAFSINVEGQTVGDALKNLVEKHSSLKDRIYDEDGKLRRYVNIYLGDEDIRFLEHLETPIEDTSELSLVPAIAGGK